MSMAISWCSKMKQAKCNILVSFQNSVTILKCISLFYKLCHPLLQDSKYSCLAVINSYINIRSQGRSHDFLGGQVYFAPSRSYIYFTLRKELLKCSSSYKMHNLFQFCTNNTCKQSMSQLGGLVACHHRKF